LGGRELPGTCRVLSFIAGERGPWLVPVCTHDTVIPMIPEGRTGEQEGTVQNVTGQGKQYHRGQEEKAEIGIIEQRERKEKRSYTRRRRVL
jgi:hypothetical protein